MPGSKTKEPGQTKEIAMKIRDILTAQCLLLAASCLQLAAQTEVNSGQKASPAISAPRTEVSARVQTLRVQVDAWEKQLQMKSEMVEESRQNAISAGIQGDGAGPYIDGYRQQQKEMEMMRASLTPKIEEALNRLAVLTASASTAIASVSQSTTPARKSRGTSGKKAAKPNSTRVASLGQ
jgi:hypothetical protein